LLYPLSYEGNRPLGYRLRIAGRTRAREHIQDHSGSLPDSGQPCSGAAAIASRPPQGSGAAAGRAERSGRSDWGLLDERARLAALCQQDVTILMIASRETTQWTYRPWDQTRSRDVGRSRSNGRAAFPGLPIAGSWAGGMPGHRSNMRRACADDAETMRSSTSVLHDPP